MTSCAVKGSGSSSAPVPLGIFRSQLRSRHLRGQLLISHTSTAECVVVAWILVFRVWSLGSSIDTSEGPSRFAELETQELGPSVLWLNKKLPDGSDAVCSYFFSVLSWLLLQWCRRYWGTGKAGVQQSVGSQSLTWLSDWTTTTAGLERTQWGLRTNCVAFILLERCQTRWSKFLDLITWLNSHKQK